MSTRRNWAWPLVPVYAALVGMKDALRNIGGLRARRLQRPVVSVGSLSAGGAGKTPMVIALARLLDEHGWTVDVLTRGYGRKGRGIELVSGDDAKRFGDEPVLIARRTGVPVWVGKNRFAAGKKAEKVETVSRLEKVVAGTRDADPPPAAKDDNKKTENDRFKVHILDDGFQHRRLARKVDVALVTTADLDDYLLPAGNLRERPQALQRADVIVVRDREFKRIAPRIHHIVHKSVTLWQIRRRLRFPAPLGVLSAGLRPVAFCAIARPEAFAEMLLDAGCGIVDTVAFPDHHRFTAGDVEQLLDVAKKRKASGFVTTEKDAVKLPDVLRKWLETVGPVVVVELDVEFVDAEAVMNDLKERLA
ncbi:MAG TPA: tetraacyldisaccharide 4'-kinase [Acidobacteriaceae bacterium]|nr:tetraacyldisaccharide 4'-kinase [Acidobacteriaceae bacterium]